MAIQITGGDVLGQVITVPQEALREQLQRRLAPQHETRLFQLRDIPSVMKTRQGWHVAAALMERWFNGAPYEMQPEVKTSRGRFRLSKLNPAQLDETTVTMRWAMGYARVHAAVNRLTANWASPAGIELLKDRVNRQGAHRTHQCWRFGNLAQPAKVLEDTCQVNYLVVGQSGDPVDDFYGAMGEVQLNVAASGMVVPQGQGKALLEIDELGFYLRDSYDFNDGGSFFSQPLGCWGFQGMACGISTRWEVKIKDEVVDEAPATVQGYKYFVQNQDFRRWRKEHHKGGDFMVLSDVLRVRLPVPMRLAW